MRVARWPAVDPTGEGGEAYGDRTGSEVTTLQGQLPYVEIGYGGNKQDKRTTYHRFRGLSIPRGATIRGVRLRWTTYGETQPPASLGGSHTDLLVRIGVLDPHPDGADDDAKWRHWSGEPARNESSHVMLYDAFPMDVHGSGGGFLARVLEGTEPAYGDDRSEDEIEFLRDAYSPGIRGVWQAFQADATGTLDSIAWIVRHREVPALTVEDFLRAFPNRIAGVRIVCEIHDASDALGSAGYPINRGGTLLATSDPMPLDAPFVLADHDFPDGPGWTFSGSNRITLTAGSWYTATLRPVGDELPKGLRIAPRYAHERTPIPGNEYGGTLQNDDGDGAGFGPSAYQKDSDFPWVTPDSGDSLFFANRLLGEAFSASSSIAPATAAGELRTFSDSFPGETTNAAGLVAGLQAWIDRADYDPKDVLGLTVDPMTGGEQNESWWQFESANVGSAPASQGMQIEVEFDSLGPAAVRAVRAAAAVSDDAGALAAVRREASVLPAVRAEGAAVHAVRRGSIASRAVKLRARVTGG